MLLYAGPAFAGNGLSRLNGRRAWCYATSPHRRASVVDGWGAGRERDTSIVGRHGWAEQDASAEPSGDRVGFSHATPIEHGACELHREGSGCEATAENL